MARVQYGAMVTALTGSVNGWTFQNNRSGAIVRARSGTHKAATSKSSLSRQIVVKYNALWQALTVGQQISWNDFASTYTHVNTFGATTTVSGANWHQLINYNRESLGLSYYSTPPAHTLPPAVAAFTVTLTNISIVLNWAAPYNPTNSGLIIRVTNPITQLSTSLRGQWRVAEILPSATRLTLDITAAWESATGLSWIQTSTLQKFKIGVMIQTVEQTSGIASAGLIVVAPATLLPCGIGCMQIGSTFIIT
jgi:hypothetical protein